MEHRLLVVSNLKAKNLARCKSHGMVLCANQSNVDGNENVEFIKPRTDDAIGKVVTFEGLPPPQLMAPAQVEKNARRG
jgi:aminoacyl tRNA synthase complex-interacting multifunctional protein 1